MATKPGKLIVIVGQTASGKSALAMDLAQRFDGEIICADSRTVYKGMDVGTAKPSAAERRAVPHHLLDVTTPDERFTAADFKHLANDKIDDILARNNLPIMVGGTGLYVDAVLFDFGFSDTKARDPDNPRHAIKGAGSSRGLRQNTLIIGLEVDKERLDDRIAKRISKMIKRGLQEEIDTLLENYSWNDPGMNAIGYREWQDFFVGKGESQAEVAAKILKATKSYAKRQKTWFKRNKSIHWVGSPLEAVALATTFIGQD